MPTSLEILRKDAEPLPEWLANYQPGDPFPFKAFFASRVSPGTSKPATYGQIKTSQ